MKLVRTAMLLTIGCALGCNGKDSSDDTQTFDAEGTITAESGESAKVAILKSFGFATNGSGFIYFASNENATCDNVVEMLKADEAYNPDQVLLAEHCNLLFKFKYEESTGFDGLVFTEEDLFVSLWSLSCGMGAGTWEYQNQGGDRDYFYTGTWWQGSPDVYETTVSEVGENISITVTMGPYSGHFIYEGLDDISATGQVVGTIEAERCTGLAQTDLFPF